MWGINKKKMSILLISSNIAHACADVSLLLLLLLLLFCWEISGKGGGRRKKSLVFLDLLIPIFPYVRVFYRKTLRKRGWSTSRRCECRLKWLIFTHKSGQVYKKYAMDCALAFKSVPTLCRRWQPRMLCLLWSTCRRLALANTTPSKITLQSFSSLFHYSCALINLSIHTYIHTHIHAYTDTYTHTCMHTYTQIYSH